MDRAHPGAPGGGSGPRSDGGDQSEPTYTLRASTVCATRPEFISHFGAFVDRATILVPSKLAVPVGSPVAFSITLRDGQPMLEGRGHVIEVHDRPKAAKQALVLKIRIGELTNESRAVRLAILMAKPSSKHKEVSLAPAPTPAPPASPIPRSHPPPVVPSGPRVTRALGAPPQAHPREKPAETAQGTSSQEPDLAKTLKIPPNPMALAAERKSSVLPVIPEGERRPGAPDTLPTNPFADVSPEVLGLYVDCHLSDGHDDRDLAAVEPLVGPPAAPASPPAAISLAVTVAAAPSAPVAAPADDDARPFEAPAPDADAPEVPAETWGARRWIPELPAWARKVWPPALSSLATLVLCWWLWGGDTPENRRPAATESAKPAASVATAPSPSPRAVEPQQPPPVETDRKDPAGRCTAHVDSQPSGVTVKLGRRTLGRTPLADVVIPCEGPVVLALSRPRYAPGSGEISPKPGEPASLFVRMERLPARLELTSKPPGARFRVQGVLVGQGPCSAAVMRFEKVRITASLKGHRPWKKTLYVKKPSTSVTAVLAPLATRR